MSHRDDCGGCRECHPYFDEQQQLEREESAFTENARHALIAAANDLVMRGNVTDRELAALEVMLDIFDPDVGREKEQQEERGF